MKNVRTPQEGGGLTHTVYVITIAYNNSEQRHGQNRRMDRRLAIITEMTCSSTVNCDSLYTVPIARFHSSFINFAWSSPACSRILKSQENIRIGLRVLLYYLIRQVAAVSLCSFRSLSSLRERYWNLQSSFSISDLEKTIRFNYTTKWTLVHRREVIRRYRLCALWLFWYRVSALPGPSSVIDIQSLSVRPWVTGISIISSKSAYDHAVFTKR